MSDTKVKRYTDYAGMIDLETKERTGGGRTFVMAHDYDELQRDNRAYIKAFGHHHVRKEDDRDQCAQCGLDLRNPIHFRRTP